MSFFNCNLAGNTGGSGGSGGGSEVINNNYLIINKVIPMSNGDRTTVDIDLSNELAEYPNVTTNNIHVEIIKGGLYSGSAVTKTLELSHAYNSETKVLTLTSSIKYAPYATVDNTDVEVNIIITGLTDSVTGGTTTIIPFDVEPHGSYVDIVISNDCDDFRTLSIENLYVQFTDLRYYSGAEGGAKFTVSYEYNNVTGIIKATTSAANVLFAVTDNVKGSVIVVR